MAEITGLRRTTAESKKDLDIHISRKSGKFKVDYCFGGSSDCNDSFDTFGEDAVVEVVKALLERESYAR